VLLALPAFAGYNARLQAELAGVLDARGFGTIGNNNGDFRGDAALLDGFGDSREVAATAG